MRLNRESDPSAHRPRRDGPSSRLRCIAWITMVVLVACWLPQVNHAGSPLETESDRLYLLNLRCQPSLACQVRLPARPDAYRLDGCGRQSRLDEHQRFELLHSRRPLVIYVHGNRMKPRVAIERGLYVYRNSRPHNAQPMDFVIWSWPSEKNGILGQDIRLKAERTDGQGLLLADFLRGMATPGREIVLVGFSFGGRVITGALHALAGGSLAGYGLDFQDRPPIAGLETRVGLIAPAIERDWLTECGYHRMATKNMSELTVLYNRRDAVLKRYWLIDRVRGQLALGYTGPRRFAARYDGSPLPVRSRDCSAVVGLQHSEVDYYDATCRAGAEMAQLIRPRLPTRMTDSMINETATLAAQD